METRKSEIKITRVANGYIADNGFHKYVGNNLTKILEVVIQNMQDEIHKMIHDKEGVSCELEIKIVPILKHKRQWVRITKQ